MANERVDRAPVEEFAAQLRRLRESAGEPSFRQMARAAHFSSSTLAEAVQGRRLPSQAVVEAFATVCGADPREWAVKLQAAAAAATAEPFADSLPAPVPAEPAGAAILSPGRRGWRYAVQAAVLVIAFALGFLARGLLAPSQPVHTAAPTPSGGALVTASRAAGIPHDGADPSDEGCSRDSTIADHATMLDGTVSVGVLELRRSAGGRGRPGGLLRPDRHRRSSALHRSAPARQRLSQGTRDRASARTTDHLDDRVPAQQELTTHPCVAW
jgi:transcriptional regulator with XRE-family HTH domain